MRRQSKSIRRSADAVRFNGSRLGNRKDLKFSVQRCLGDDTEAVLPTTRHASWNTPTKRISEKEGENRTVDKSGWGEEARNTHILSDPSRTPETWNQTKNRLNTMEHKPVFHSDGRVRQSSPKIAQLQDDNPSKVTAHMPHSARDSSSTPRSRSQERRSSSPLPRRVSNSKSMKFRFLKGCESIFPQNRSLSPKDRHLEKKSCPAIVSDPKIITKDGYSRRSGSPVKEVTTQSPSPSAKMTMSDPIADAPNHLGNQEQSQSPLATRNEGKTTRTCDGRDILLGCCY